MTQARIPLIFGEVLFDHFSDGRRVLGGAPFNVAWHLSGFGFSPRFVSRVGNDQEGKTILDTMNSWGMDTQGLQVDSQKSSGNVLVELSDGNHQFEIPSDQVWDAIETPAMHAPKPSLVYHGSLALRSQNNAESLQNILDQTQAPVFLDVNLRDPWWTPELLKELLGRSTWVKLNEDELELLHEDKGSLKKRASSFLVRHGLKCVYITCGENGAVGLDSAGAFESITPQSVPDIMDTVGAGDAFASICIAGIIQNWRLARTLKHAQEFASQVIQRRGATFQDRQLYLQTQKDWT